jgi:hypothetical protein
VQLAKGEIPHGNSCFGRVPLVPIFAIEFIAEFNDEYSVNQHTGQSAISYQFTTLSQEDAEQPIAMVGLMRQISLNPLFYVSSIEDRNIE